MEVIQALTRRVRVVEARDKDLQIELSTTQQQLQQLRQEHQDMDRTSQDLQVQGTGTINKSALVNFFSVLKQSLLFLQGKNESLNSTVMALSSQVGSLQVREEELSSRLKLKVQEQGQRPAFLFTRICHNLQNLLLFQMLKY